MQARFLWCAGADVAGASVHTVVNPFTGEPVTQLHLADTAQLEVAIATAATAFAQAWRQTPAFKRADILLRTASLIGDHTSELATQIALEAGKPITTAQGEVQRAIATFTEAAHVCRSLHGEQIPMDIVAGGTDRFAISFRQPLGVVAAIAPFNFPLNLVAHKVAPALAAGNTVVLKPPSDAPSAALILARLLQEAGLPPGCLEVVPCRGNVAERLATHPQVQVLTFTGSAAVGWHLRSLAAEKRVMLELGSMSPAIVHSDADVALAVERCVFGGYAFAGQVCIHTQRLLIQESIYDDFMAAYLTQVAALKVGDPLDPATFVGPLIRQEEVTRIDTWVQEAQAAGATCLAGGRAHPNHPRCYLPTVLADVPATTAMGCQEVFGPVTTVAPYREFAEAIAIANSTPYRGLNSGVFTQNYHLALQAGRELQSGAVLINDSPSWRVDHMPYGGFGKSGSGREGPRYAVEEMTELKLLVLRL